MIALNTKSAGRALTLTNAAFRCRAVELAENTQTGVHMAVGGFGKFEVQFFATKLSSNFSENGASYMFRGVCRRGKRRA